MWHSRWLGWHPGEVPSTLSLRVTRDDDYGLAVTPIINGQPLTELVGDFEARRRYKPTGGYYGLVIGAERLGDLTRYYLGQDNGVWPTPSNVWLLGCVCGEPGCWPLRARIVVETGTIAWTDFAQPHRDERDYTGFGPFVFEQKQYEETVRRAVAELSA